MEVLSSQVTLVCVGLSKDNQHTPCRFFCNDMKTIIVIIMLKYKIKM